MSSIHHPTALFNQAIKENWNHETDWLWLANQVSLVEQQAVCLERALFINPTNCETERTLKMLHRQMPQEQTQSFPVRVGQATGS